MKMLLMFLPLFAIAVTGCVSDTSGIRIENSRLIVDNPRFASHFRISHHLKRQLETGFLQVQLTVQNDDRGDVRFQYRFEWLDADGMLIEETSPMWQVASIHGKDRKVLEGVSESKQAADFRLVIRSL
ncbi:MAG: DUF1425 domain-containing protein [Kiritimatiellia bacterium]